MQQPRVGFEWCPVCSGQGRYEVLNGDQFVGMATCDECEGVGQVTEQRCHELEDEAA
jgi:DnaJ-class molecular chaperone